MKKYILKSTFVIVGCLATLTGCVNDNDYAIPELNCTQPNLVANRSVEQVIAVSTSLVKQYTFDDIIEAYVVSSDEAGNFYKSISLQTKATATVPAIGFSVPVDNTNTYIDYRPGTKVYIKLKDLYTDIKDGSMRIGGIYVNASASASVGRLSQTIYKQKLIASCTNVTEDNLVKKVSINDLKNDANLNTLLELSDVQFEESALGRHYYELANDLGGATNWNLTDAAGNKVIFRTSSFANFASNLVPTGNGKVRGVLTKYGSDYQFMARTEADVKLTNPRISPIFEESFTSNFPNWTKFNVLGAQVWTLDTTFGNPGSCAKMSGFASGNQANEDWLISPAIDLTKVSSAILSFETAAKFAGNNLEIYISTDYAGSGAPSTANWSQVTANLSSNTTSYVWTASGPIDLKSFAGKTIYIGFKYTSTTTGATTWEVDNVKIIGN